jgi:DNA-binding NarL/FixJ family response regulator
MDDAFLMRDCFFKALDNSFCKDKQLMVANHSIIFMPKNEELRESFKRVHNGSDRLQQEYDLVREADFYKSNLEKANLSRTTQGRGGISNSGEQKLVQILLVDDHSLMRRGLKGQFALEAGFSVVGEAVDGAQAIELAAQLQPDVVLMDIELPVMDGITATQQIKSDRPATRIIALSAFDNNTQVMGMLAAGADGYCLKTIAWEQLMAAIQLIVQGGAYLDSQIAYKVAQRLKLLPSGKASAPEPLKNSVLTERECELLKLIAKGQSNKEIANQLYLSLGTVKSYVRIILNKLSVDDRVQAAAKAVREGWI